MRKTLIVALSLFLLTGLATAQTSQDFTTDVPNIEYQLAGLDSTDLGYEDNGDIGQDPTEVYRTLPSGSDEALLRNSYTFESETDQTYTVDIKYAYFDSSSYDNIVAEETLQSGVSTNQLHTVEWDESDWTPSFVYSSAYPAIVVDAGSTEMGSFTFDQEQTKPVTTTYTETLYNGTLSSRWNNPPLGSLPEDFSGDSFIADGGTVGNHSLGIETEGTYVLEYEFDEPISGDELKYWSSDISIENNTEATYGFISDDVTQNSNHDLPYDVVQGVTRFNNDGNELSTIIHKGNKAFPSIDTIDSVWNEQNIVTGGGPGTVSMQITEGSSGVVTWDYQQNYDWNHLSTWNALVPIDTGVSPTQETMPASLDGVEYTKVALVVEQVDDNGEMARAYFDDITYDSTASDLNVSEPFEPGESDPVDGIEEQDEIVDGGIIDDGIRLISNTLGVGLNTTRILLALMISLAVGVAVGWNEDYGSPELATMTFLMTYISLIFVGLMPTRVGIVSLLVLVPAAWIRYKNGGTKVNT